MIIGLASPAVATSLEDGLDRMDRLLAEAAGQGARIVCFPEAWLPGLRGLDFDVFPFDEAQQTRTLDAVARLARRHGVATILGTEQIVPEGRRIAAVVFAADGTVQGVQAKTQLDPSEDRFYVPGTSRRLFEVEGVKIGIVICHEGWRYPETVRWAAVRGARIVFHPHHTGSNTHGTVPTRWGDPDSPYYEKAMMLRALENTIWFASVNYALRFPESATSIITPSGECHAFLPYGEEGVLVRDLDLEVATGLMAGRFARERF